MDFYNEYSHEDDLSEEQLLNMVLSSIDLIESGTALLNIEIIEETVLNCIENDFVEEGLLLVNSLLEVHPFNSEFWQYKGILLNNKFEFEEAYFAFQKSLSLSPNDVETLINKSIAEENLDLIDDAIYSLKRVIEIENNNEEAFYSLGYLYERVNKFEDAIIQFKNAIELDEEFAEAWYELGYCYEAVDNLEKALEAYDKFLEIEPNSFSGWYNIGIVKVKENKFDEAVNSFELSKILKDNFASSWFNCGVAYANLGRFKEALINIKTAVLLDETDETIWYTLGQTYEDLEQFEEAIKAYTKALQLENNFFDALTARAVCFNNIKKTGLALQDINSAISLFDLSTEAWQIKAKIEKNRGDFIAAINSLNRILEIDKDNFEVWTELSKIYFELGNIEESKKAALLSSNLSPEKTSTTLQNDLNEVADERKKISSKNANIKNEISKEINDLSHSKKSL